MTSPERWAAQINELAGTNTEAAGAVAFVGDRLVIGQADGVVRSVELASGETVWTASERHDVLQSIAGSPDGRLVASCGSDRMVRVWSAANGSLVATYAQPAGVWQVQFAPDGERLATAGADDAVAVYRLGSAQRIMAGVGHDAWVTSVDWSPRGDRLATVSNDATLRVWDAATGSELVRKELAARSEAVAWSAKDQLAVGLEDGSVVLIDARDALLEVARLRASSEAINGLQWAAGGRLLAAGAMDAVLLWDHQGAHELARFEVERYAHRVAWSPDATIIAASLGGDRVHLWDVPA